jgi:predicted secreted Zn-dependent protease
MPPTFIPATTITPGVFHTFKDATLADLVANLDRNAEAGEARFKFGMKYTPVADRVTNLVLTVSLAIDMPRWPNVAKRPKKEQDEWNRFLKALRFHEDGHIAIFRSEAYTAWNKLQAATPATINQVLADEETRIQALSDAYDVKTDSGMKQTSPHGTTVITVP